VSTLILLSGCPEILLPASAPESRDLVSKELTRDVKIGESTRVDVLLALGEPDQRAPDDSWLVYSSTRSWAAGLYPVALTEWTVSQVTISFDDAGVVSKVNFEEHSCPSLSQNGTASCVPKAATSGSAR
jgi:hypothetical protein